MLLKLICLVICIIEWSQVKAFPSGPSPTACQNFIPTGHGGSSNSDLGYSINAAANFNPGSTVTITLNAPSNFRGLIMQVRNEMNNPSGTLALPSGGLYSYFCDSVTMQTVGHNSRTDKSTTDFLWTAPSTCESTTYTIRATVVQAFRSGVNEFQTGLTTTINCVSATGDSDDDEDEDDDNDDDDDEMPMMCGYGNVTNVPANKYNTSFETDNFNGWTNVAAGTSGVDFSWTRGSGGTPSSNTGPNAAADGQYYLFAEASFPRVQDDRARLITDQDLQGCFCLQLQIHRRVDANTQTRLEIAANNNLLFSTTDRDTDWEDIEVQVDTPDVTQIRIDYIRGTTFRGDIAIDDIKIEPGLCSDDDEDEEEEEDTDDDTDDETTDAA